MSFFKSITESLPIKITIKQFKSIKGKVLKNHFFITDTNLHEPALKGLVKKIKHSGRSFSDDEFQTVESFVYKNNVYGSVDGENWYLLGSVLPEDIKTVNSLLVTSRIDKLTIKHSGQYAYNKVGYNVYLNFYGSKDDKKKD